MNVFHEDLNDGLKKILDRNVKICVIGIGTIGLPLATFLSNNGFFVKGLDISQKRVDDVNRGEVTFEYSDILKKSVSEKKLIATIDPEYALKDCEILMVCVPTPLNENNEMDISNLYNVAKRISPIIKKGMLLIFESSVAIGTTSKISKHIEELTELKFGVDLGLAYCPERYNPTPMKKPKSDEQFNSLSTGINFSLDKISRVVGGIDEKSTSLAQLVYSQFVTTGVTKLSSIESAEATKLVENIFRDVNIALVNEFAKIFPKFNLDIFEIIDAAKTKPFAFMPHYPGAGVGGECIPVDTWYLISQAEQIGLETNLMKVARQVNDSMPNHMVQMLETELNKVNKNIQSSKISILGLCYKKNIPDIRLSPTLEIISIFKQKKIDFIICDPHYENQDETYDKMLKPLAEFHKNSDAIMLVTDHDIFKSLNLSLIKQEMRTPIIVDGRNFFSKSEVEKLGFKYSAIGKPQPDNHSKSS